MAKAKKKAAQKSVRKAAKKKTIAKRKPAATRGRGAGKVKRAARKAPAAGGVRLGVSAELDMRLRALATQMGKSLEDVLVQALTEFADNWEDHLRTVKALGADDDRMQLAVRPDDESAP